MPYNTLTEKFAAPKLRLPPIPSAEELIKRGIVFEQVHPETASPVRLRHRGHACGIFVTREAAGQLIKTLAVLAVVCFFSAPVFGEVKSDAAFLAAIAAVEATPSGLGAAGEQSIYQLHPLTIEQNAPGLRGEITPQAAEVIARRHLVWLRRQLVRAGVDDSAFNLALAWNAGLTATLEGRAPVSSYRYASRVAALAGNISTNKIP